MCLQIFQLLHQQVARSVFLERTDEPSMREMLRFLIQVIQGEVNTRFRTAPYMVTIDLGIFCFMVRLLLDHGERDLAMSSSAERTTRRHDDQAAKMFVFTMTG